MRARHTLTLLGTALILVVPTAAAAPSAGEVVASANGGVHWTIPLPNPFGVEVGNRTLAFNARKHADGGDRPVRVPAGRRG